MEVVSRALNARVAYVFGWLAVAAAGFAIGFLGEGMGARNLLVAAVVLIGVSVLLVPYKWAVTLLFAYLGVEGAAKIVSNYHPVVHVGADLVVAALCGRWFIGKIMRREPVFKSKPPLTALFAVHAVWFLICFFNPYSLGLYPSLAGAKVYVSMLLLFPFGYYLARSKDDIRHFMKVWVGILLLQVAASLYQVALGPSSVLSLSPHYADKLSKFTNYAFRPFGTTSGPGGPATFIFLATPFVMFFLLRGRSWMARLGLVAALPLAAATLVYCQVRASMVKAMLGAAYVVGASVRRSSRRARIATIGVATAAVLATIVALPKLTVEWTGSYQDSDDVVTRSLSIFDVETYGRSRAGAWSRIVSHAKIAPLGAGLSRTGSAATKFERLIEKDPHFKQWFFADNFWAATIADIGIPGSLILTALILTIWIRGYVRSRKLRDEELAAASSAILAAMLASIIGFWGAEGFLYNPEAAFFWFFGGVLIRIPELER